MTLVLVVDGGATKTVVSLRDEKGIILFEGETTGSNYQVIGPQEFRDRLKQILSNIAEKKIDKGVFALAGIDTEEDHEQVLLFVNEVLDSLSIQVTTLIVENDAYSTLLGLTKHQPGVLMISGTGSIAFAHDGNGQVKRSGGWGHRTGDQGSGYWIGREIILEVVKMHDGRGPNTLLMELVLDHLSLSSMNELTGWLYGSDYSVDAVAGLSVLLEPAYHNGDAVAEQILEKAVKELSILVGSVIRSCGLEGVVCPVYLNGGTIKNFDELYLRLKDRIENGQHLKSVRLCTEAPIESIYQRALVELNGW